MQLPHNIWLIYIQDFLTVKLGHIWHKGNVTVLYTIYTKNSKNTATKYRTCYSDCVIYIPTCVYQREILAKMSWCNCLNIYLLSNDNYHIQYIYTIQRPELSSVKKIFKFQILTSLSFFIAAIYRIIKCSDILAIAYFIEKVTHVKFSFISSSCMFLSRIPLFLNLFTQRTCCANMLSICHGCKRQETETHRAWRYYLLCISRKDP